ncbi:Crp/Fnr family transcriptional regulator [Polaromonas sp. SM01]|uniref:Crp/Fnr family transcriptional regulator n=1 Tax=Polaromonas sp. SM01 TaxID=3085630 RepID=UPI002982632D|nr:Crp/Fnr family transcriptional regulator [Polaromonas sp. SM01]MDW5441118.1 Crp/Fnr family transcriptional regulator [Polaromonas sp. SM01]
MDGNEKRTSAPSAWIELPGFTWAGLTGEGTRTLRFAKGQTLFSQGDAVHHVYVVEQGRVRLVLMSAAGHEKHMAIVGTHGMVGECSAFLDGKHSLTAVASSDVVLRQVEREQLLACLGRDASCLRQVLWLGNVKLRILANQNLLLSHASAAQRVAYHLVQLAETYGEAVADGIALRISFTHQEMANLAGLSRVMTSNVLIQLHEDGLVDKVGAHCVIHDIQGLRQRTISL